jgi:hypothetical protein
MSFLLTSKPRCFGRELEQLVQQEQKKTKNYSYDEVPIVLSLAIETLSKQNLKQGIFRVSGSSKKVKELKKICDSNKFDPKVFKKILESEVVQREGQHTLTSFIKQYFICLPNPVINYEIYPDFLQTMEVEDEFNRILYLKGLVNKLSRIRRKTLKQFIGFLHQIQLNSEENQMDVKNLAISVSGSIIGPKEIDSISIENNMVEMRNAQLTFIILIKQYEFIFEDKDILLEIEETISEHSHDLSLKENLKNVHKLNVNELDLEDLVDSEEIQPEEKQVNGEEETPAINLESEKEENSEVISQNIPKEDDPVEGSPEPLIVEEISQTPNENERFCDACGDTIASIYCKLCEEYQCKSCEQQLHLPKKKQHHSSSLISSQIQMEKEIGKFCVVHHEPLKLICFQCKKFICLACAVKGIGIHFNHETKPIQTSDEEIEKLFKESKEYLNCKQIEIQSKIDFLSKQLEVNKAANENILALIGKCENLEKNPFSMYDMCETIKKLYTVHRHSFRNGTNELYLLTRSWRTELGTELIQGKSETCKLKIISLKECEVHIGITTLNGLNLDEELGKSNNSWSFKSTGEKCHDSEISKYQQSFGSGDVVTMNLKDGVLSFSLNEKKFVSAFEVSLNENYFIAVSSNGNVHFEIIEMMI